MGTIPRTVPPMGLSVYIQPRELQNLELSRVVVDIQATTEKMPEKKNRVGKDGWMYSPRSRYMTSSGSV